MDEQKYDSPVLETARLGTAAGAKAEAEARKAATAVRRSILQSRKNVQTPKGMTSFIESKNC